MWIYCIENVLDGKCYIGQTTSKNADHRLRIHFKNLRAGTHGNIHLQRAWNRDGELAFISWIVCEASDIDELDLLEYMCVEAQKPNVYNMIDGGDGYESKSAMSKIRWSNPKHKEWRYKTNDIIWNDPEKRTKMLSGLMKYASDSTWKSEQGKRNWQNSEYRDKFEKNYGWVKSPSGEICQVQGLRKFSREYGLDPSTLSKLCGGKYKQYRGWTKYDYTS